MRSITAACHFWKWFRQNEEHYLHFFEKQTKKEGDYYFDELQAHARACNQWLGVDIMVPDGKEKGLIVITAAQRPRGFKKAHLLASKAPVLDTWIVHALRQPNPVGAFVKRRDFKIDMDPNNMWFQTADWGGRGRRGINVFVEDMDTGSYREVYSFVNDVLENLIGEYALGMDIDLVEIDDRSNIDHGQKLYSIEELPAYWEKHRRKMGIDDKGKIVNW